MKKEELTRYISFASTTIVDAMKKIDENNRRILYVVDSRMALIGCVTDGDIRRWIIGGGSLDVYVGDVMNKSPMYISTINKKNAYKKLAENQIESIAVVDEDLRIDDIVFSSLVTEPCNSSELLKGSAVIIMAGGKGTRLHPFTKILPKPLIPIGDIPIIERVMDSFIQYGVDEFYMTINYKKEMIKSYFSDSRYAGMIHYVEEPTPLGTAGSIGLINEELPNPVVVTNCDILIEADYSDIISFHKNRQNDLTIVSSVKNTIIPYGVLETREEGIVTALKEKPEISSLINTGMYVIDPEYFKCIPQGEIFHMTDLAELMLQNGKQVAMYPISENAFLDMGQFDELRIMEERINSKKNTLIE